MAAVGETGRDMPPCFGNFCRERAAQSLGKHADVGTAAKRDEDPVRRSLDVALTQRGNGGVEDRVGRAAQIAVADVHVEVRPDAAVNAEIRCDIPEPEVMNRRDPETQPPRAADPDPGGLL